MQPALVRGQVWHKFSQQGEVVLLILDDPSEPNAHGDVLTIADFTTPDFEHLSPDVSVSFVSVASLPPAGCTLVQTLSVERCAKLFWEAIGITGGIQVACATCSKKVAVSWKDSQQNNDGRLIRCAECKAVQGQWGDA
jgi:DNA-directed RNA polymerase subunit RPC12/RpoP